MVVGDSVMFSIDFLLRKLQLRLFSACTRVDGHAAKSHSLVTIDLSFD